MTSIFESLSSEQQALLKAFKSANGLKPEEIKIGDVFRIKMDETNGITPKDGLDFRPKYFIILGVAPDGTLYGGVVINKEINTNIPPEKQLLHKEITQDRYPFLTRQKSYINCSSIMQVSVNTILTWEYLGVAPADDIPVIISAISAPDNRFIRKAKLKQLGIIK